MLVRGRRVPIVGSVCMDMTMIDVTGLDVSPGDEVVIIGEQGEESIGVREMAAAIGTIPYELLCRVGTRIERVYEERTTRSKVRSPAAIEHSGLSTLGPRLLDPREPRPSTLDPWSNEAESRLRLPGVRRAVAEVAGPLYRLRRVELARRGAAGAGERPGRRGGGQRGRQVLTGVHVAAAAVRRNRHRRCGAPVERHRRVRSGARAAASFPDRSC